MKTQLEQLIVMINQIVDNNSYGNTPEQTADATYRTENQTPKFISLIHK